jgi:hypothetical protein
VAELEAIGDDPEKFSALLKKSLAEVRIFDIPEVHTSNQSKPNSGTL